MAVITPSLPRPQSAIQTETELSGGRVQFNITPEWYAVLQFLMSGAQKTEDNSEDIVEINKTINNFVGGTNILGLLSVLAIGNSTDGYRIELVNDENAPGDDKYYGTDGSGAKGWHDLPPPSFVPFFVPDGETFTIPANQQALFSIPIELGAGSSLEINGALVGVD